MKALMSEEYSLQTLMGLALKYPGLSLGPDSWDWPPGGGVHISCDSVLTESEEFQFWLYECLFSEKLIEFIPYFVPVFEFRNFSVQNGRPSCDLAFTASSTSLYWNDFVREALPDKLGTFLQRRFSDAGFEDISSFLPSFTEVMADLSWEEGQWIKDSVRAKVVPSLLDEELGGLKIPSEEEVTRACKAIKIDTANMLMDQVSKYGVVQKYDFTGGGLIAEMDEDDGDHSSGWASIAVEAVRVLNAQELRHLFG